MVEGGMTCIKYLIFAFNLIFFLFGAALLGLGIYVQVALKQYLDFFSTNINGPAIVLIVVGLVIFVVAFFGCCGAIKENYCMVITFSILMGLILLLQVSAAIAGLVYKTKVADALKEEMNNSMQNFNKPDHGGVTAAWNSLQNGSSCCGVNDPSDWKKVPNFDKNPPASCCKDQKACEYSGEVKKNDNLYSTGCYEAIENTISDNVYYVGAVGIALAVIQVTGIVLACCLARGVRKEYEIA